MSTYKLAICTIFDSNIYGKDEESSPDIDKHFLVLYTFNAEEFYNDDYKDMIELTNRSYTTVNSTHSIIRNYSEIIKKPHYIKLDIIKCDELVGLEQVGYIKTFWLKIVQRRWKKIYKQRQEIMRGRLSIMALQVRDKTGQWPKHLRTWPKFNLFTT